MAPSSFSRPRGKIISSFSFATMAENTRKVASHKRIILCADGTWQASDIGSKSLPSNVAKLARAISNNGLDDQGNLVKQIVSYHSGLGSGDLPFQKLLYGTFGWGLDVDVCQIYDFISNNYEAGDELFFFGWSRGAFTVRSVAALVCEIGVLSAVNMSRFAEMWEAYRANTGGQPFRESKWYLDNKDELGLTNVKVKVVGVWDTVGALGIPEWPVVKWARKIGLRINSQYAFHDTKLSTNVEYAFQALALDERRLTFPRLSGIGPMMGPPKTYSSVGFLEFMGTSPVWKPVRLLLPAPKWAITRLHGWWII
ncbi:hypothetical protein V2G26_013344 [Clonostachys chloroleuca]